MNGSAENDLAKQIVDASYTVHQQLGPGLLESVYEAALAHELSKRGISAQRQVAFSVRYDTIELGEAFRADIVVDNLVIVELKSVEEVSPAHKKQLLTYLRASGMRLGLLINFGEPYFKKAVTRVVNGLPDTVAQRY